jgi:hypothetical protein
LLLLLGIDLWTLSWIRTWCVRREN